MLHLNHSTITLFGRNQSIFEKWKIFTMIVARGNPFPPPSILDTKMEEKWKQIKWKVQKYSFECLQWNQFINAKKYHTFQFPWNNHNVCLLAYFILIHEQKNRCYSWINMFEMFSYSSVWFQTAATAAAISMYSFNPLGKFIGTWMAN